MEASPRFSNHELEVFDSPDVGSFERDALFSQLAETVDAAILIYQGDHHVYANSAIERVTGYSRDELLALDPFLLIYPDDRERVREYTEARKRGDDAPLCYEVRFLTKGGAARWMEFPWWFRTAIPRTISTGTRARTESRSPAPAPTG